MIERTKNYRRVKRLAPDWDLVVSDKVYYLVEVEGGEDVGVICVHPYSKGKMMIHIVFSKLHRGKLAAISVARAFNWVFKNTGSQTIVAKIPAEFRRVHFLAQNVGMVFDGVEESLFRCYHLTKRDFEERAA